jgi:hypothetical protein
MGAQNRSLVAVRVLDDTYTSEMMIGRVLWRENSPRKLAVSIVEAHVAEDVGAGISLGFDRAR